MLISVQLDPGQHQQVINDGVKPGSLAGNDFKKTLAVLRFVRAPSSSVST